MRRSLFSSLSVAALLFVLGAPFFAAPDAQAQTRTPTRTPAQPRKPTSAPAFRFPLGLPSPPTLPKISGAKLSQALDKIRRAKIFSSYREAIDIYRAAGRLEDAARLLRQAAAQYRAKGLLDAAAIHENEAHKIAPQLAFYLETPSDATLRLPGPNKIFTGARLEPVAGAYLGAFIDLDDGLGPTFPDRFARHRAPENMKNALGRHPGTLFTYLAYGQNAPLGWIERLHAQNTIPVISWEPKNLNDVRDDAYLNDFARALNRTGGPVFVRFASEMNGSWTPYHHNPALYRQKFRLVHQVMRRHAPRVATLWVVNNPPARNWDAYYPGDDGCDWVGVNFYAVPYSDNNPRRPNFDADPLALLEPFYRRFAARKPIAIGEFGVSHRSGLDNKPIPDFAIAKTRLLYEALPLRFPRVKMVNWFSADTIKIARPGKNLNDFRLSASPRLLSAWQRATDSPWFLTRELQRSDPLPPIYRPLNGQTLTAPREVRVWAKVGESGRGLGAQIYVALDGKVVHKARGSGATRLLLDPARLSKGRHVLAAFLYDEHGRFQRTISTTFVRP